jgi:hypothetical protein
MIMHDDASTSAATMRRRWFCAVRNVRPFSCILAAPLSWPKGPFDTLDDTIEEVAGFQPDTSWRS